MVRRVGSRFRRSSIVAKLLKKYNGVRPIDGKRQLVQLSHDNDSDERPKMCKELLTVFLDKGTTGMAYLFNVFAKNFTNMDNKPSSKVEIITYLQKQKNKEDRQFISFLEHEENFQIKPVSGMNIFDKEDKQTFTVKSMLGIGGQGCVLSGEFANSPGKLYAFKLRRRNVRTRIAGRASPIFRRRGKDHKIVSVSSEEEKSESSNSGKTTEKQTVKNILLSTNQETLYKEAVAMFSYASNPDDRIYPQPIMYGTGGKNNDYEFLVSEMCKTTLQEFFKVKNEASLVGKHCQSVWIHFVKLVVNCYCSNIVHMDFKPDNICFDSENGKKQFGLIDFGIAKNPGYSFSGFISDSNRIRISPGTSTFMSPRTHLWYSASWVDDLFSAFLSMIYFYGKMLTPVYDKSAISTNPEAFCAYCWTNPSWTRIPHMPIVKESITDHLQKQSKERLENQIIIAASKLFAIVDIKDETDIYYALMNADGLLSETFPTRQDEIMITMKSFSKKHGDFMKWWIKTSGAIRTVMKYNSVNVENLPIDYGNLRAVIKKYELDDMFDSIVGKVDSFYGMCTNPTKTTLEVEDLKCLID